MKRLATLVAAAAVALGGVAAPVQAADNGDRALALLLGAAAVGYALHQTGSKADREESFPGWVPAGPGQHDWRDRDDHRGWGRRDHRVIPQACVFDVHTDRGRRDVVSGRCVAELARIRDLPDRCSFEIRTNYGPRTVYSTRCLSDRGYRIEGTRRHW